MGEKTNVKRDIFISYRREGGDELARTLYLELSYKGYSTFYDLESLRNGKFNEALYWHIEHCTDFLVILPPNSLDRCQNEGDWVRNEIAHAIKHKKNIIPVMLPGFTMPEKHQLPKDIQDLVDYNGPCIETGNVSYPELTETLIRKFLTTKPNGAVFGLDRMPHILQKQDDTCTILLKEHFRCPQCGSKKIYREDQLDKKIIRMKKWTAVRTKILVYFSLFIAFCVLLFFTISSSAEGLESILRSYNNPALNLHIESLKQEGIAVKTYLSTMIFGIFFLFTGIYTILIRAIERKHKRLFRIELHEGSHSVNGVCHSCKTKFIVISQDKRKEDWIPKK